MENIVRGFAQDLTRGRRYNYSHDSLQELLITSPEISTVTMRIANPKGHNLDVLLLKQGRSDTCILYAHGLGSNKLQVLPVAKYFLRQGFDVCSFDFSGSGRSEGSMTTYGIFQKDDVLAVLQNIQRSYQHVVLWGRSMGAVAVVLAHALHINSKVECLILDSPFSSFEKVAIETAAKKSFIPQFMISMVMDPLKKYFLQKMEVNPFTIDLQQILSKIETKILLIYSLSDSVVSCSHAQDIIRHCKRNPQEIVIKEDHNMLRSKSTLAKALNFICESGREVERRAIICRSKNRGISVTSKEKKERSSVRSSSKIKLFNPLSKGRGSGSKVTVIHETSRTEQEVTGKSTDRYIRTIASLSQSIQYSKRIETENSPTIRKRGAICSVLFQSSLPEVKMDRQNKQNIKPSLNMLRRNRFR